MENTDLFILRPSEMPRFGAVLCHFGVLFLSLPLFCYAFVVNTAQGPVKGFAYGTISASARATAFMGIPFAQPPTGPLRYKRPEPPELRSAVYDATKWKPMCPQNIDLSRDYYVGELPAPLEETSEDCLYLNVFIPNIQNRGERPIPEEQYLDTGPFPVLVFLHGGKFEIWSHGITHPEVLVTHERVIIVTLNYRLGPLGFLCLDEAANLGLLDQRAALSWVKDNIQAFGGHLDKISLFGFSAGASSANLHMLMPSSWPLFNRVIIIGGASLSAKAVLFKPQKTVNGFLSEVGCEGATDQLACLRKRPLEVIMTAYKEDNSHRSWRPCVDGSVIGEHPFEAYNRHHFKTNCSILLGHTATEGCMWIEKLSSLDASYFHRPLVSRLLHQYLLNITSGAKGPFNLYYTKGFVNDLLKLYEKEAVTEDDSFFALAEVLDNPASLFHNESQLLHRLYMNAVSDHIINVPIAMVAEFQAPVSDVYKYVFNHRLSVVPKGREPFVASCHGDDLYMFTGVPFVSDKFNDADRQVSRRLMSHLGAFARSGSPFSPEWGGAPWTKYGGGSKQRSYLSVVGQGKFYMRRKYKDDIVDFWMKDLTDIYSRLGNNYYLKAQTKDEL